MRSINALDLWAKGTGQPVSKIGAIRLSSRKRALLVPGV